MKNNILKNLIVLILLILTSLGQVQAYTISVDGAKGRDGSREHNYSTNSGASSGRGSDGRDSSRSSKGQDAGRMEIFLKEITRDGQPSKIEVTGLKIDADGRRSRINEVLNFGNGQILNLSAVGGRGGHGGHGGNGQGGCNGRDGRDAHKRSSAGDGTDGCNGGDGGDGTPGSNGGVGGQIIVNVTHQDVHILRSISINIDGGSGGNAGKNGRAGSGGRGGDGGRGDTWREKTGTRPVRVSYTDYETSTERDCNMERQGDGSYKNVCSNRTVRTPVTKYRTEYEDIIETFSTPGGRDGSNGRSGSSGHGNTSSGMRGNNGSYVFKVNYSNGSTEQYRRPFELKILSYNVVEDESTRNGVFEPGETIHLENITVSNVGGAPSPTGKANVFTSLRSSSLQVIKDKLKVPQLRSGERHTFRERLTLRIPNDSQVGRNNPVEILHNIIPTASVDKTRMRLREFGLQKALSAKYPVVLTFFDVPEVMAPGERLPVMVRIKNISSRPIGQDRSLENDISVAGGDTPRENISFDRIEGEDHKSLTWAIESVGPGDSVLLETFVSLAEETPVYTGFSVRTDLLLTKLEQEQNSILQSIILDIKVAAKYRYREDSSLLLITNSKTERAEYNAWMEFGKRLGIKIDVWDLSYYGAFSLTKQLESGSSLMENYRNKTIVFVKNGGEDTERAIRSIRANDFLRATKDYNINFLFLGGNESEANNMIQAYLNQTRSGEEAVQAEVKNNGLAMIFQSFRRRREEAISNLNEELLDSKPGQRFIIESKGRNGIVARPALGIDGGQAYAISYSRNELRDPRVILSEEMKRAIILPLSFNNKLNLIENRVSAESRDAVLFDLIHEINLADQGTERSDGARLEIMSNYLALLNKLEATEKKDYFNYILAGVSEFAKVLDSKYLKGRIQNDLSKFENDQVKSLRAEIKTKAEDRIQHLPGISERDNLKNMLTLPAVHRLQSTEHSQDENIILENQ